MPDAPAQPDPAAERRARAREKAAERNRRYRARQKCGLRVIPLAVDADLLERLIEQGRLAAEDAADQTLLAEALLEALEDLDAESGGTRPGAGESDGRTGADEQSRGNEHDR